MDNRRIEPAPTQLRRFIFHNGEKVIAPTGYIYHMVSIGGYIPPGETSRWETNISPPVDVSVQSDRAPYTIDLETKRRGKPDSEYEQIRPITLWGVEQVSHTDEVTFTTNAIEGAVRVVVSNMSGERMSLRGSVTASDLDVIFAKDGNEYVEAGRVMVDNARSLRYDPELDTLVEVYE